jgi:hypothetical protein
VGHQPGGEAVDHAQQPFVGKHPPGGTDRQRLLFADDDDGGTAAFFDLDRKVVECDVEVARDAFQGKAESRRRQHGAAEKLETAAPQRARKQGEALVVEAVVDQAVEGGIAGHGNAGIQVMDQVSGNSCMFQKLCRAQSGAPCSRQNAGYKAHCDRRRTAGGGLAWVSSFGSSLGHDGKLCIVIVVLCHGAIKRHCL